MFSLPVSGKRTVISAKGLLIIPLLLLLIAPAISSKQPVMEAFFVKYFWLTFIGVFLVPLLFVPFKKLSVTWTDLLVMLFTVYIYSRSLLSAVPDMDSRKITYFLIAALAYFAVKRVAPADRSNVELWLLAIVFLTTIVACIYGIFQKIGLILPFNPKFPVTGTFYHPASFAGFLAGIFPMACYSCYRLWKRDGSDSLVPVVRIMAFVTASVIIFILPSVQSRAAVVGLIAGSIFMAASIEECKLFIRRIMGKGRHWKLFLIITVSLIFIVAGYRLRTSSADGRLLVWEISGKMILDKPLWGFGTDAFRYVYPDYQIAYFRSGIRTENEKLLSYEVNGPFNEIIHFCCEWGIIGLLLFVLIIVSAFKNRYAKTGISKDASIPSDTSAKIGAKAALVSWMVFGQFAYPFSLPELTLYFFVFLALADSSLKVALLNSNVRVFERIQVVFIVVVGFAIVNHLIPIFKTWQGIKKWNVAVTATDSVSVCNAYSDALPLLKNNDIFLSDFARTAFRMGRYNESAQALRLKKGKFCNDLVLAGEIYEKLSMPDSAMAYYKDASFLLPHRFTPLYKLMRLYEKKDDLAAATAVAKEILAKQVKIESYEVYEIKQEASRILHHK